MLKAAKNMRGKLALLYRGTGRPGHRLHIFLNSTYEQICAAAHICSDAESMNMQSSHHQMFEMKRFKRQITQHISIPLATGKLGEFPQKWSFWTQICAQIDTLPPFYDAEGRQEYAG